jgi:hypothetical protein
MHFGAQAGLLKTPLRQLQQAIVAFNPFLKKAERERVGARRVVHPRKRSVTTDEQVCGLSN